MKVKELAAEQYQIVAIMEGDDCPAENFMSIGEATYESNRDGLRNMLFHVARSGLDNLPPKWSHEVDKNNKIYEFIKGDLRLLFFKGSNGQIAVCTTGLIKKTKKVDKSAVEAASRYRDAYFEAIKNGTLEVITDET